MYPQPPPPLNLGGTVLEESVDLDTLGVAFDGKMTFVKHLRYASIAASLIKARHLEDVLYNIS